jgi:pilus assembly protein TadC
MSTRVYTGLNTFNFIRKHFLQIRVRKIAVNLQNVLEVMSTSVYTGLNTFNFIRKHFLQICVRKVAMH